MQSVPITLAKPLGLARALALAGSLAALSVTGTKACEAAGAVTVLSLRDNLSISDPVGSEIGQAAHRDAFEVSADDVGEDLVLVTREDGLVGEVERRFVKVYGGEYCESPALAMQDLPQIALPFPNPNTPLKAKVLVGETQASRDLSDDVDGIAVFAEPSVDAREVKRLRLFDIRFVHAFAEVDGEPWFYIGLESAERVEDAKDLDGWIRAREAIVWPQRLAAYPTRPGVELLDEGGAPQLRLSYADEATATREQAAGKLPVLEIAEGELTIVAPAIPTGERAVNTEEDDLRQRFRGLRDGGQNLDVLFVIDNTESMNQYRDAVVAGISTFIESFDKASSARFAYALYGDALTDAQATKFAETRGSDETLEVFRGRQMRIQLLMRDFAGRGARLTESDFKRLFGAEFDDQLDDVQEMGLEALSLAIRGASWDGDRPSRIVVFIGDDYSRDPDIAAVAQDIVDFGVSVVPINVRGRRVDEANMRWIRQMEELDAAVQGLKDETETFRSGGVFSIAKAYDGILHGADDLRQTRERVAANLSAFMIAGETIATQEPADFIESGIDEVKTAVGELGLPQGEWVDDWLNSLIGDREGLRDFYTDTQLLVTGYVRQDDMGAFVVLTRSEHSALRGIIENVCISITDRESFRSTFENLSETLVRSYTGERNAGYGRAGHRNETLAGFLSRVTTIPRDYFSVFQIPGQGRDLTLEEFITWARQNMGDPSLRAVHEEICRSASLLELVNNNQYACWSDLSLEPRTSDEAVPSFRPTRRLKRYSWLWGLEVGVRYYFVPKTFFPLAVTPDGRRSVAGCGGPARPGDRR